MTDDAHLYEKAIAAKDMAIRFLLDENQRLREARKRWEEVNERILKLHGEQTQNITRRMMEATLESREN